MSHTLLEAVILLSDAFQAKRCSSLRYGGKLILFYFIILQQVDFTSCTGAASLQSCLILCDPWTVARQAPRSVGFSRQEYWSGLPFPSPADLPDPGIKPMSPVAPAWQADSLALSFLGSPRYDCHNHSI